MKQKIEQWEQVQAFFADFRQPDGAIRRGWNEYATPTDFERELNQHLRQRVKRRLADYEAPRVGSTAAPAPAAPPPPLWKGSPFPGLRAFTPADAPIFFGRGRETDGLLHRLADPQVRFLAVVGASGSGKSSLVAAGLIPRLRDGAIPGSQDWVWVRFTPGEVGDNPFMALAVRFHDAGQPSGQSPRELAEQLAANPAALIELCDLALAGKPDWAELLLFVDQFEELFTLAAPAHVAPFVAWLSEAAQTPRLRVVATLRADFYHRCVEWPVLAEWLRTGTYPLAAPGPGALHEMITRPAERAGLSFEEGLAGRILDDTGAEPGALALLAFALHELYEKRTPAGALTWEVYNGFDGVPGAIARRADKVFTDLDEPTQAVLEEVFRELVEVDERGVATRRRARRRQVCAGPVMETFVDRFTAARLLVTDQAGDDRTVEVAHEALLRSWPRLVQWIEGVKDDLRLRHQLGRAAEDWQNHERAKRFQWSDERAVEAGAALKRLRYEPSELEQRFLGPVYAEPMLAAIDNPATTHEERAVIGVRLALIGDPRPGVGLREDKLPDLVWCEVPGGKITLEGNAGSFSVKPFAIAKYPVTWIQYRAFVEAADGYGHSAWWQGLGERYYHEPGRQIPPVDNHPAVNVDWFEAVAFCRWLSHRLGEEIRLPTEWEWQQAATGGKPGYEYPWGPDWGAGPANTYESGLSRTVAVGLYPLGASPVGAMDMAGNVWEWCLNEYEQPDRTGLAGTMQVRRVVRGGSWRYAQLNARAPYRLHPLTGYRNLGGGLRVVCAAPLE